MHNIRVGIAEFFALGRNTLHRSRLSHCGFGLHLGCSSQDLIGCKRPRSVFRPVTVLDFNREGLDPLFRRHSYAVVTLEQKCFALMVDPHHGQTGFFAVEPVLIDGFPQRVVLGFSRCRLLLIDAFKSTQLLNGDFHAPNSLRRAAIEHTRSNPGVVAFLEGFSLLPLCGALLTCFPFAARVVAENFGLGRSLFRLRRGFGGNAVLSQDRQGQCSWVEHFPARRALRHLGGNLVRHLGWDSNVAKVCVDDTVDDRLGSLFPIRHQGRFVDGQYNRIERSRV